MVTGKIEYSEMVSLIQLQDALRQKYSEEMAMEQMRQFCLDSTSKEIQKKGMEFLFINGYLRELRSLIEKNKQSFDPSNRKWAEVYKIQLQLREGNYKPIEVLERINQIETNEPELLCLLEFAKVNIQFNMHSYHDLGNAICRYEELLPQIDDYFLVENFKIRYHLVTLTYTLMQNEIIMTRKHGYKLLNLTCNPEIQVETHIKLGESYTFDSYSQGMFHLRKALKIAKDNDMTSKIEFIEQTKIPFLAAYFNKTDNITTTNKSEQAHLEIMKGNYKKAIEILEQVPINTPFEKYYLGKAKQDKSLLIQSYKDFVYKRNDNFFCRLPLHELKIL
ncbi:AimR family lysis-lysogeny pheromone receptor [Oceanobacillus sp. Castelsardo]|uniref:AimR family lysis-lysogeny pheromone receptor n=1 Tax=Oceanobacillus sp. Castelsardo TaxID=1851204 RepID=UPI000839A851|nr:AimR family lysis-lysogeny pheromone receptor [Oceanobacillus sp. Castelsardo]